ncbi:MAG: hypothetical protein ACYC5F_06155 [Thermoleophilia bacterium]
MSSQFQINWLDLRNAVVHALIASAVLVLLAVVGVLQTADFGVYQGAVTAVLVFVATTAKRFLQDNTSSS